MRGPSVFSPFFDKKDLARLSCEVFLLKKHQIIFYDFLVKRWVVNTLLSFPIN